MHAISLLKRGTFLSTALLGLAIGQEARAAETNGINFSTGSLCQLSIPTTDTKFRPKATGARNESTSTSSFVICPLPSSPAYKTAVFTNVLLGLYSIDGASHNVSCTAVSGWLGHGYVYSTKTLTVTGSNHESVVSWAASDFGGTSGNPIAYSLGSSVTCNLPPQTAIEAVQGDFTYEVGS